MTPLALILSLFPTQPSEVWYAQNLSPFLVDFPGTAKLSFFGWHVVVVYLLVMIILAQIVYHNNRKTLYRYYQLYAALLLIFLLTRNSYWIGFHEQYGVLSIRTFGYLVQIGYLCVYFRFGILFLKLDKHTPVFTKRMYTYTIVASLAAVAFYGMIFANLVPYAYGGQVFYYLFLPVHVSLAGLIIYKSVKTPEPHMQYFLWGSFFYIAFALISTFALSLPIPFAWFGIQPIVYFFIAIVLECTMFAIGLGKQINDHLKEKRKLQALLRDTEREMEIKILRGQLNSHFIFNVLNSIKAFIVEREVDEATDYLGKFSKFMRGILEGSRQETTTLRAELKTILLYADIENMRLSNAVAITHDIGDGVDLDAFHLPAMVLQPFLENAIWHGLSKSTNPGKTLRLRVTNEHEGVHIIIEDNGLGYSNTQTTETKVFAKSYGLRIVREQLQRFNARHGHRLAFTIDDREGGGTRVVFTITTNPQG